MTTLNVSMASLGQLGHILESGRLPDEAGAYAETGPAVGAPDTAEGQTQTLTQGQGAAQRRRRRIVRGEGGAIARRPTVSSREEGRALGLARGASMRRTNVWDGELTFYIVAVTVV